MCEEEEEEAPRRPELARGYEGTRRARTRLLGTRHQQRHRLSTTTDLVSTSLLGDVPPHCQPARGLPTRSSGVRANEAKEKCFTLWRNKRASQ